TWNSDGSGRVGVEGHRLYRAAHRLRDAVHGLVGQLDRLELPLGALRRDERLGRILGVPGHYRIGADALHLPTYRKAVGFVDDCVHGSPSPRNLPDVATGQQAKVPVKTGNCTRY